MTPEVKKRVFEPFYTTKTVGQGTGLGLSVSYSIITNNHKGSIEVESQPGQGTCFRIRLPLRRGNGARQGVSA
jgi:signal transduction histidine kinase